MVDIATTASQVSSCSTALNFGFFAQLNQINGCQVLQCILKSDVTGDLFIVSFLNTLVIYFTTTKC